MSTSQYQWAFESFHDDMTIKKQKFLTAYSTNLYSGIYRELSQRHGLGKKRGP